MISATEGATITPIGDGIAGAMARIFHETYENLAPLFGYETRPESNVAWENVPEKNRRLMLATCSVVYQWVALQSGPPRWAVKEEAR